MDRLNNTQKIPGQRGSGTGVVLVVIAVIIILGVVVYMSAGDERGGNDQNTTNTATSISYATSSVSINSERILSIEDFADRIRVSEDAVFGGSERINNAMLSPDNQRVAVAVSGAAHDFGWVYNRDSEMLRPVAFQYGGSVEISEWQNDTTVVFDVNSPKPETTQKVIDVTNLPEYPRVATSTSS